VEPGRHPRVDLHVRPLGVEAAKALSHQRFAGLEKVEREPQALHCGIGGHG
jgi:hypothetical protein